MDARDLYDQLVTWLSTHHPLVYSQWERERKRAQNRHESAARAQGQHEGASRLLQASSSRARSRLEELSSDASVSEITRAMELDLQSLGISGGTPGVTPDGAPCIHLIKKGVYGSAYEESVTLARLRDPGYRRHLKQVFG